MVKEYKGWIPTVGGRLSFTVAGTHSRKNSHHDSPVVQLEGDAGQKRIYAYQVRDLSDIPPLLQMAKVNIFKKIVQKITRTNGRFIFLYGSENSDHASDIDAPLSGRVLVYRYTQSRNSTFKRRMEPFELCNELSVDENLDQICSYSLVDEPVLDVSFQLTRRGECKISSSTDIHTEIRKHALSEVFFFLKDFFHAHQHHNPRQDTIADLHEFEGNNETWINETLRSMYRKVLDFKRCGDFDSYMSAKGMLSYINTFVETIGKPYKKSNLIVLENNNILESLDVAKSKFEYELSEKRNDHSRALAYTAFALTIVLTYSKYLSLRLPDGFIEKFDSCSLEALITRFVVENPLILVVCFAALYFSLHSIPRMLRKISPASKAWVSLFVSLKQHYLRIALPIGLSVLFLCLSVFVFVQMIM